MNINYNQDFIGHFNNIWDHISKESLSAARKFRTELKIKIEKIPYFPYKYRQSFHYSDKNIRDYIFKGYTIPYLIDEEKDTIIIMDIFKWQDRKTKQ